MRGRLDLITFEGNDDLLITAHLKYECLGTNTIKRQYEYQQLFIEKMSESTVNKIRSATNKAWVLGNKQFKRKIEEQLKRRVAPVPKERIVNQKPIEKANKSIESDPINLKGENKYIPNIQ